MIKFNKVIACLVTVLMLFSLSACSGGADDAAAGTATDAPVTEASTSASTTEAAAAEESTTAASAEEPLAGDNAEAAGKTLSVLVSPTVKMVDITTNDYTLWLEEQTGVHLDFTVLPSGQDGAEPLSMMLNSGETLPDIIMAPLSFEQQYLYGQQGVFSNLSPLIEQYAPRITQAYKDYPLYAATSTRLDGNIYYITAYEECFHCTASQKMWINQQWLDNLGLSMPATTDEFKQTLIAFRDGDANGNGDASDEIPMSGMVNQWHSEAYAFLMNAFVYFGGPLDPFYVENGTVSPSFASDAWREGLTFMNDLFNEGLLDENAFVQDGPSVQTLATGDDVLVGAVAGGHPATFCPVDNPNVFQWTAVPPLKGPGGVQFSGYYPNVAKTSDGIALSSTCSDPQAAMEWVDFLFTEESTIRSQYGVQGRDWEYNDDPTVLGLNDEQALFHTFDKPPVFQMTQLTAAWEHTAPTLWIDYIFAGQAVVSSGGYDMEKDLYDETFKYIEYFPEEVCSNLQYEGADAEFIATTRSIMGGFITQAAAEFIIGTRDINDDGAWDSYLSELEGYGLTQYTEIVQRGYTVQQEIISSLN